MSELPMKCVLSGYGFDAEGPILLLDDIRYVPWKRSVRRFIGQTLTISRRDDRYCTGRYAEDDFLGEPCPNRSRVEDTPTCDACQYARGFNPAFYHSGDRISPQQRRYNAQPHAVYLAHFGAHTMKVGIANSKRERARLLEQGARMAAIVARCSDAYEAREIEERVRSSGVPEVVRSAQKRRLIEQPFRRDVAEQELSRLASEVVPAGDRRPVELIECNSAYGLDLAPGLALTDIEAGQPISGTLRACIGEFVIAEQAEQLFVASLRRFIGYEIVIEHGDICYKGETQMGFRF
jgi:hypothetical protein